MNETMNYCGQCGAKLSTGAKFCSNCGHDLKNSSANTTLDKTIKVEVTNATVEKGFKTVGKGFDAIGGVFKRNKEKREDTFTFDEGGRRILEEAQKKTKTTNQEDSLFGIYYVIFLCVVLFYMFFPIFKSKF